MGTLINETVAAEKDPDDAHFAIAGRVRLEREARSWSIADLAARSGVSKAAISKIERGETSPTATVLIRLATAFDLTLAGFLLRAESGGDRLVRAADQPCWTDPETGYVRRQIFQNPDNPIEVVEVALPQGQSVFIPASSYRRIRQTLWLREGALTIEEGSAQHDLEPGDCLGFGTPEDVRIVNRSDGVCRYVVTVVRT
jgi:transcriptional regulator with XRE-family HTH domain